MSDIVLNIPTSDQWLNYQTHNDKQIATKQKLIIEQAFSRFQITDESFMFKLEEPLREQLCAQLMSKGYSISQNNCEECISGENPIRIYTNTWEVTISPSARPSFMQA